MVVSISMELCAVHGCRKFRIVFSMCYLPVHGIVRYRFSRVLNCYVVLASMGLCAQSCLLTLYSCKKLYCMYCNEALLCVHCAFSSAG